MTSCSLNCILGRSKAPRTVIRSILATAANFVLNALVLLGLFLSRQSRAAHPSLVRSAQSVLCLPYNNLPRLSGCHGHTFRGRAEPTDYLLYSLCIRWNLSSESPTRSSIICIIVFFSAVAFVSYSLLSLAGCGKVGAFSTNPI